MTQAATQKPNDDWREFLALTAQHDAVTLTFNFLARLVHRLIGTKLLTASRFDVPAGIMSRIYSDDHDAYPLQGIKPIPPGIWSDTVIRDQQMLVRLDIKAIADVFFDWKLIQSLGCGSVLNIPVVVAGRVIGAINLLHEEGYYTDARVAYVAGIMPFAVVAFMLDAQELRV